MNFLINIIGGILIISMGISIPLPTPTMSKDVSNSVDNRVLQSNVIENASNIALALSQNLAVKNNNRESMLALFNAVQGKNKSYQNIYFAHIEGKFTVSPELELPPDYDARTRVWYKQTKENNKLTLSEVYTDIATDKQIISIACPVKNDQGQFVGVLGIDVALD